MIKINSQSKILNDQKIEGYSNLAIGRDQNSTKNYFFGSTIEEVGIRFLELDKKVVETLGRLSTSTNATTEFSSERLFASLVNIGIPVQH